jgi:hypothetical protein
MAMSSQYWASVAVCFPRSIPFASPSVKIASHAPIEGRAKSAVRQWDLSYFVTSEWADAAMRIDLMKNIPNPVQAVTNDKRNREPQTQNAEHDEHNHRFDF